jgi:hypothetical protein
VAKIELTLLAVLLLLTCVGCANSSGIRYGSTIEIDASGERTNERRGGAGLFFEGNFGRIRLG